MLPAAHRLTRSVDFTSTTRRGVKVARPCLVVHVLGPSGAADAGRSTQIGFSVGKGIGGSVVRHCVARRLRAQSRGLLSLLPAGCMVVVRALPRSSSASSARLGDELASAFSQASAKLQR